MADKVVEVDALLVGRFGSVAEDSIERSAVPMASFSVEAVEKLGPGGVVQIGDPLAPAVAVEQGEEAIGREVHRDIVQQSREYQDGAVRGR